MGKNEKTPITVNDKEYLTQSTVEDLEAYLKRLDDMTDKQKALLNHVNDLGRKMDNAQFNLDQLAVGRQKFVELLADALENPAEVEEAEVVN